MTDHIVSYLEDQLEPYLRDLDQLVSQDSGSYDNQGIEAINSWLQRRLEMLGFTVERNPQEAFGDDLIGQRRGRGKAKIMLLGHSDTVYPRGTASQRPMTIEGDRIKGPGTGDMKAGLLAGIYALQALQHVGWDGYDTLTYLVVSDEEIGERHSIPLLHDEGPRHDAILTLEAARENGDIVTARKAVRWYTVEAFGRSAHVGVEPEKGHNAALAIAHVVVEAARLNGMCEGMTVNVGQIAGGDQPNVVADHGSARFDVRAWTGAHLDELEGALRRIVETEWVPGVRLTMIQELNIGFLPRTLSEALAALEADDVVTEAVGGEALKHFLVVKRHEVAQYDIHVHPWERATYLEVI